MVPPRLNQVLFIVTIYILLLVSHVNGDCCICGETPTGGCYEPQAPSNRVYMEGSNNDGVPWTCGGTSHYSLQAGPCGIAQANAFKDGNAGCECPIDNRPVKQTPPCVACDVEDLNILQDGQGNERWFVFTAGALSCTDAYGYALQGFIPSAMCDTTKDEMVEFGCCGSGSAPSGSPPPPPPPPPPPAVRYCTSNNDCSPYGLACDERQSPFVCSDYLSRAKRTRSKRLCRKNRGGSRAGC